jgi:hypothetical protein
MVGSFDSIGMVLEWALLWAVAFVVIVIIGLIVFYIVNSFNR